MTDFIFRRQFPIEWGHCDPAGIVFNSRFFEFFDRSAWLMFEAATGVPPHELSKAFIVLKDGYTADDSLLENLRVHVKERAGPWKFPRWIDVRDNLPRTATGKLQRFKLRDLDSSHP